MTSIEVWNNYNTNKQMKKQGLEQKGTRKPNIYKQLIFNIKRKFRRFGKLEQASGAFPGSVLRTLLPNSTKIWLCPYNSKKCRIVLMMNLFSRL